MSHDRGCSCGNEPYEYSDCRKADCPHREPRMDPKTTEMVDTSQPINTEFANDRQVGGSHYQSTYQHWDWAIDFCCGPIEYAATKYVSRWWKKGGKQDLEKARHYVQKIMDAFSQSRYPHAFSRLPKGSNQLAITGHNMRFAQANDLSPNEAYFCLVMITWSCMDDLRFAMMLLDEMLRDHQTAAGRRGAGKATVAAPAPSQAAQSGSEGTRTVP